MTAQSIDSDVAVLKSQMATTLDTVGRIETKLDTFNNQFVTKAEFEEFKKRWFLSHTMAGIAGAVLASVIVYIINNLIK